MGASVSPSGVVLVVEDDDDIRLLVTDLLEDEGFEVTSARTMKEAMPLVDRGGVSLVLLDHETSWDRSRAQLDAWHSAPRPPVIVFSASVHAERLAAAVSAAAVIHKPFDVGELVASVREHTATMGGTTVTR